MIPSDCNKEELHKLYIVDDRGLVVLEFFIKKHWKAPTYHGFRYESQKELRETSHLGIAIRDKLEQEARGGVSLAKYHHYEGVKK